MESLRPFQPASSLSCLGWERERQGCKEIARDNEGRESPHVLHSTNASLVQSLNSTFFPPPIGAELGQAERESRIICMRMLRTK